MRLHQENSEGKEGTLAAIFSDRPTQLITRVLKHWHPRKMYKSQSFVCLKSSSRSCVQLQNCSSPCALDATGKSVEWAASIALTMAVWRAVCFVWYCFLIFPSNDIGRIVLTFCCTRCQGFDSHHSSFIILLIQNRPHLLNADSALVLMIYKICTRQPVKKRDYYLDVNWKATTLATSKTLL